MITIYLITNKLNGKTYVGSTKDYSFRVKTHLTKLKNNTHDNIYLQRAFNKYGNIFEFTILEDGICPSVQFEMEAIWAEQLSPEYNIGSFGGGDNLTKHPNRLDIIARIKSAIKDNIDNMSVEERKAKWGMSGSTNPNWRGGISKSYCGCGKEKSLTAQTCAGCRVRSGDLNPFYGKEHTK